MVMQREPVNVVAEVCVVVLAKVGIIKSGALGKDVIDLTLVDRVSGARPDMGTPYDSFSEAAHTANAMGRALRFRQILVRAMESEGFTNYEKEWWHFSYPVPGARPFDEPIRESGPGAKIP